MEMNGAEGDANTMPSGAVRIDVQAWSPEYSGEIDLDGLAQTVEDVDTTCEPGPWEPREPGSLGPLGDRPIAFVDGVERIEARLFVTENGSGLVPGLAGSIGVGSVICDPAPPGIDGRKGGDGVARRAEVDSTKVDRFLAVGDGMTAQLSAGAGLEYGRLPVPGTAVEQLQAAIHDQMRSREAAAARDLIERHDALVFVDGPFAVMSPGATEAVGIIKSHRRRYLDDEHEAILGALGCGQRTPIFAFSEKRPRYSWYVRLCELNGQHAWHGLIRCEAPAELSKDQIVVLADASAALLPAFASAPYWDPRAPQNLVPIAGLEKRLHHLLGDRELIYRMIKSAANRLDQEKTA